MEQKTLNNQRKNKKKEAGGFRLPDFRLYYIAAEIKIVWYWHKNRNIHLRKKTESPLINHCTYDQLIHDKGSKNTH